MIPPSTLQYCPGLSAERFHGVGQFEAPIVTARKPSNWLDFTFPSTGSPGPRTSPGRPVLIRAHDQRSGVSLGGSSASVRLSHLTVCFSSDHNGGASALFSNGNSVAIALKPALVGANDVLQNS